jgi:NAD(P)-dependent dehydrogenase (short-subunit alcohol dehydrogenase family)
MNWADFTPGQDREAYLRRVLMLCPTPRLAPAEDVAHAALFLASDHGSFISGVGLPIDGAKAAGVFNDDRYRTDFALL